MEMEMVGLEPTPFVCKTNVLPVILHPTPYLFLDIKKAIEYLNEAHRT
jgi:hypothetical protein